MRTKLGIDCPPNFPGRNVVMTQLLAVRNINESGPDASLDKIAKTLFKVGIKR